MIAAKRSRLTLSQPGACVNRKTRTGRTWPAMVPDFLHEHVLDWGESHQGHDADGAS